MAPERSRSTCGDSPQHAELLIAQPRAVLFSKAVALNPEDVGHLHGRRVIYLLSCDSCGMPG